MSKALDLKTLVRDGFVKCDLEFKSFDLADCFSLKKGKSLGETLLHRRYSSVVTQLGSAPLGDLQVHLGEGLMRLKMSGDGRYRYFLNKWGDQKFCKFKLTSHLSCKGLYAWVVKGDVQYIGRCLDSFKKRVNGGYGSISPKNCFIDGQSTNCHLNALINSHRDVELWVYDMSNATSKEISDLELSLLRTFDFNWNIQNNKKK